MRQCAGWLANVHLHSTSSHLGFRIHGGPQNSWLLTCVIIVITGTGRSLDDLEVSPFQETVSQNAYRGGAHVWKVWKLGRPHQGPPIVSWFMLPYLTTDVSNINPTLRPCESLELGTEPSS